MTIRTSLESLQLANLDIFIPKVSTEDNVSNIAREALDLAYPQGAELSYTLKELTERCEHLVAGRIHPTDAYDDLADQDAIARGYTPYQATDLQTYRPYVDVPVPGYTPFGQIEKTQNILLTPQQLSRLLALAVFCCLLMSAVIPK